MEYKSARKILSENLEQLMKQNNITQIELSEAIGVSQSTISNWIKEIKYPRIGKVEELAEYFNVPKSRITERQDVAKEEQDTIAAHLDGDDFTEDEIKKIREFADIVRKARKG